MRPEQPQPYTMTRHFLRTTPRNIFDALQEISKSPPANEELSTSSMPNQKQKQNAYQLNTELNLQCHGRH